MRRDKEVQLYSKVVASSDLQALINEISSTEA
jgi:hypothetical protein